MRTASNVLVDYFFENEAAGYAADLLLTIKIWPGDPGDRTTPPAPAEFELLNVDAVTITMGNYDHRFSPADRGAELSLRRLVETGFYFAYEADGRIREMVESDAADEADGADRSAEECAIDWRAEAAGFF